MEAEQRFMTDLLYSSTFYKESIFKFEICRPEMK
jgi:hypothetical protein